MEYYCNTPVLLIFFNRADTFVKVFEQVRKAKPKNLILAQDGPRDDKDLAGILACRKVVENIDWDCEIIYDYSEINLGCGVRPQSAITNALKQFEQVIILEDDCVPADSFFRYCDEMLEKYKDDDRIAYISGLNHFGEWNCGESDYFFTKSGAIWGWATWSRAWNRYYDYYVQNISDEYVIKNLKNQFINKQIFYNFNVSWQMANKSLCTGEKLSYWDAQWGYVKYSQNMLVIVPRYNQIYNIGFGQNSTHAQNSSIKKYKKGKTFFCIPTRQLNNPINHPKAILCDTNYDKLVYKCTIGNPIRSFFAKIVKRILKKIKK